MSFSPTPPSSSSSSSSSTTPISSSHVPCIHLHYFLSLFSACLQGALLSEWDGLGSSSAAPVVVLGATNRPMDLDKGMTSSLLSSLFFPVSYFSFVLLHWLHFFCSCVLIDIISNVLSIQIMVIIRPPVCLYRTLTLFLTLTLTPLFPSPPSIPSN